MLSAPPAWAVRPTADPGAARRQRRRLRGSTRCAVQRPRARSPRRRPTMDRQLRRPLPGLRRPTRHLPRRRSVARLARHPLQFPGSVRPGSRTVALRRPQSAFGGQLQIGWSVCVWGSRAAHLPGKFVALRAGPSCRPWLRRNRRSVHHRCRSQPGSVSSSR